MLNAYGRVDRGRLFPLDRGDDKNSAFGTTIGDTYERFKNIQKSQDTIRDRKNCEMDIEKCKKTGKNNHKNPERKDNTSHFDVKNSTKKTNKNNSVLSDKSVVVSDTLLSNLLINSVLSALRKGKLLQIRN